MYVVVTLSGQRLVEDPSTHKTVGQYKFLIYDYDRNRYYDSTGNFHSIRSSLFYPFTSFEEAKRECDKRNKERRKMRPWLNNQPDAKTAENS